MSVEQDSSAVSVTAIRLDMESRAVEFEDRHGTVARVDFSGPIILFDGAARAQGQPPDFVPPLRAEPAARAPEPLPAAPPETGRTVTLTGKLKTAPKAGRPDRTGKPTAWARLATHEEDQADAHLYLATFHRHTAGVALGLRRNDQVTVEGYPHPATDPDGKRLDTFSVIAIHSYPGKPASPRRER